MNHAIPKALAVPLLVACLLLGGCQGRDASATEDAADDSTAAARPASTLSLPVVGQPVRQGDLVLSVTTTGQVRSDAVARLKAEAAGTVLEVLVTPGARVRKGQPLVRLDPRPFELAVREAQAAADQAEVTYTDNIVPDSIVSGRAPSAERRQNALARSGLAAARVRLERAEYERERAVIAAPFSGVVDRIEVAAGERIAPNQDIATIVDTDDLRIEAAVLEHDLALIEVGGEAIVTTAAAPDEPVRGRVAAVLPLVDSTTRAGRVIVRARGSGAEGRTRGSPLRPGMYTDVRLEATRLADRTVVPARAVLERDGRPLVFVVKEGRAQWVYVTPGRTNGAETEVLADSSTGTVPVAVGDTVLVEGHLTLTHDAPVRVMAREEAP